MMISMSDIRKLKHVKAKLGTMRKAQDWLPQPCDNGDIVVQSDKRIGRFNPTTGAGMLSTRGSYFIHLLPEMGAMCFIFPEEFVKECVDATMGVGWEQSS